MLITDALQAIVDSFRADNPDKADRVVAIIQAASHGEITSEQSRQQVAAELEITVDEYVHRLRTEEVKNQTLLDYILQLKQSYKIGLLSNISPSGLEARFSKDELAGHFDAIAASGVIGYAKPEPQAYEIVAEMLGARLEECVMVDDREDYCNGARAVGMQAIQYIGFDQLKTDLAKLLQA